MTQEVNSNEEKLNYCRTIYVGYCLDNNLHNDSSALSGEDCQIFVSDNIDEEDRDSYYRSGKLLDFKVQVMTEETLTKWNIAIDYKIAATLLSGLDEIKDRFTEWSNDSPETELWKERLAQIEVARKALFDVI